jgi:hypothetical protein
MVNLPLAELQISIVLKTKLKRRLKMKPSLLGESSVLRGKAEGSVEWDPGSSWNLGYC